MGLVFYDQRVSQRKEIESIVADVESPWPVIETVAIFPRTVAELSVVGKIGVAHDATRWNPEEAFQVALRQVAGGPGVGDAGHHDTNFCGIWPLSIRLIDSAKARENGIGMVGWPDEAAAGRI